MSKQNKIDKYFNKSNGFGIHKDTAIELLDKTIKILNEFDIDNFLISGTLLGYARHKDLIPWDDDIDLLVNNKIFDQLDKYDIEYGEKNIIFAYLYWAKQNYSYINKVLIDRIK